MGGFGGSDGSVWVMGEWLVGRWIVGVMNFQKMYGLFGLRERCKKKGKKTSKC